MVGLMTNPYTYTNRYRDVFTFTPTEDGDILWEGNFEYCRVGYPNDYTHAYRQYSRDGGVLSLEEFKEEVHKQIYENEKWIGPSEIAKKYSSLVVSRADIISMVDPSGGPYISQGMDSEMVHPEVQNKTVKEFLWVDKSKIQIILQEK
jgi:hypothetical protein